MKHEVFINTSTGRRTIIIDDDFCKSLSVPVGRNGDSVALFVSSWVALLADSPLTPGKKPLRLYYDFLSEIRARGIKATVVRYADLAHVLVSQHSNMGTGSSTGDWIDDFKNTPVFREYHEYYRTCDVTLMDFLYTFLNFGKKLDYVDESFNSAAFRSWSDVEKRLSNLSFAECDILSLKTILQQLLPTFSWDVAYPKFGPGSVSERGVRGRICKIRNLAYDTLIDRFLLNGHIGNYGYSADSGLSIDRIIPDPSNWHPARGSSSRSSRLQFVPKNLKVARSICMEPNTLMYFQQAVLSRILELMRASSFSRFINLENQQRNRDLALFGSFSSEIDTLDLSAASDSVHIDLVKKIFPPSWQIPMLVTRTHEVITHDGTKTVHKFAPMGSALCFPTQCLIFASVCILSACITTYESEFNNDNQDYIDAVPQSGTFPSGNGQVRECSDASKVPDECSPVSKGLYNPSDGSRTSVWFRWLQRNLRRVVNSFSIKEKPYRSPGFSGFQPLAVYGDDICVDFRLTDVVKAILLRTGFVVNNDKSFTGSQSFRESCGGYYLCGVDISPLFYRVKGVRSRYLSAAHIASQVHLINECKRKRLYTIYRFLHATLMDVLKPASYSKTPIRYVDNPEEFGILANNPVNSHLQRRLHVGYQRYEVVSWTITYTQKLDPRGTLPSVERYEYMRWWSSRRGEAVPTDSTEPAARYDTRCPGVRWRWTPSY
jgi:hypothetical protein